jgi:hypothetical protein
MTEASLAMRARDPHADPPAKRRPTRYSGPPVTLGLLRSHGYVWLSERLGQSFVIENRVGASGNIAAEAVVRAPADGHTLLQITATNAINATLYDDLNFDFICDIVPIASIDRTPDVMEVNPRFRPRPFRNSSPMRRLIRAKSIWRPQVPGVGHICTASCSR